MESTKNTRNAGRKPLTDERFKCEQITMKVPKWLMIELRRLNINRTRFFIDAVCEQYDLHPPEPKNRQ